MSFQGLHGEAPKLRLLYLDTEEVWRGGQEQLLDLMVGLRRRGHEVWLGSPAGGVLQKRAQSLGLTTFPFSQRNEADFRGVRQVGLGLRGIPDIHVLHLNTPRPILLGAWLRRRRRIPLLVVSRRVDFPLRSRLSVWKYSSLPDRIFTVSESIRETLITCGVPAQKVEVVYEGIDIDAVDRASSEFVLPRDKGPVIGIVAHLSAEKGHQVLLQAASLLKRKGLPFYLVVVGDGELREALELQVRILGLDRHVWFTGFRFDCRALFKQMDVFCLPSISEGLSSAIMTAMAARLPVVATQVGGIPELVVDNVTGRLVSPGDAEELAAALETLILHSDLARQWGRRGRLRVERYFSLSAKLDATESAYRRALGGIRLDASAEGVSEQEN